MQDFPHPRRIIFSEILILPYLKCFLIGHWKFQQRTMISLHHNNVVKHTQFPSTKLSMQTHCSFIFFFFLSCESTWKTPHGDCKQAKIVQRAITSSFRFFGAVQIAQWPKTEIVKTNILQYY